MPRKEFHGTPFDDASLIKLELFSNYFKEWLPVFIHNNYVNKILVLDLFCGPGRDSENNEGSPLKLISVAQEFEDSIRKHNKNIEFVFNDIKQDKIRILVEEVKKLNVDYISYKFESKCGKELLFDLKNEMSNSSTAVLAVLDQTGINIAPEDIRKINKIKYFDYLLYYPAGHIYRFQETKEFTEKFSGIENHDMNRQWDAIDTIKSLIKKNCDADKHKHYIGTFGIKKKNKGHGLSGIIFGSNNPLGLEKFLRASWNEDPVDGSGLYCMFSDITNKKAPALPITRISVKHETFKNNIIDNILKKVLRTNKDIYFYTIENYFLPEHAVRIIKDLIKNKIVLNKSRELYISYSSIFKTKKTIQIILNDNIKN